MMNFKIVFVFASMLLLITVPAYPQGKSHRITESEAIRIAEDFIIKNGYTDLPPIDDKSRLSHESIEWTSNTDELLKDRHDSLKRKAFGISHNRKGGSPGWTVVFQQTSGNSENGRAVTMDLYGRNIRVEHQDFILAMVGKKLAQ